MITAFKKKFGPGSGNGSTKSGQTTIRTGGITRITTEMQSKFSHGVNFNLKVVIKGDRAAGKTCLFRRLQGHPFDETYTPTDEIQVANVLWNYRTADHIVKLDVWDVVDASSRRNTKKLNGLKLENNSAPNTSVDPDLMLCDATFIDVYKNCNGVLLMFDVTKSWTWKYACKELDKIPSTIPILLLANKSDVGVEVREVHEEEITTFLSKYNRKESVNGRLQAPVRFTACSAKTAHGLKYIYNFLNIPFLFLQREYLEKSLEANKRDIDIAQYELDCFEGNSESPAFSAESHRKALPTQDQIQATVNHSNGVLQKKRLSNSSSSEDEAHVNMFEEDFDPESHKVLDEYVSKTTKVDAHADQMLTSFNEILEPNSSLVEELSTNLRLDANLRLDDQPVGVLPSDEVPEKQLDNWLDDIKSSNSVKPTKIPHTRKLSTSSSDSNPLVAKFEDIADSESDSHQSHGNSTSHYTAGQLPTSISKHKTVKNSSALEDFLSPPNESLNTKAKKVKSKSTKKSKSPSDKPLKKSKKGEVSNILVDDNQTLDAGNDQYDPL